MIAILTIMGDFVFTGKDLKRFWQKVDKASSSDDCWPWTGAATKGGYGNFWLKGKYLYAHRFSYWLHNKVLDSKLLVDHICHNKACVNPNHLRQVTHKQNNENQKNLSRKNTSGFRGVSKSRTGWTGEVTHGGTRYRKHFPTKLEAVEYARGIRNMFYTHNDADKELALSDTL